MKEKFIEASPELIAETFEDVGAHAIPGESFVATHNRVYASMLNSKGATIFNHTTYTNPLQHEIKRSMPYGDFMEYITTEVESWPEETIQEVNPANKDWLKQYPAKVSAEYSSLSALVKAPLTIWDRAVRKALTTPESANAFYGSKLEAQRKAMDLQRFILQKEVRNSRLRSDALLLNSNLTQTLTGVTALNSKEAIMKLAAAINRIATEMGVSTQKYNPLGITGQAKRVYVDIRASVYADLMTYAADVYHIQTLINDKVVFIPIDDFGGLTSSVPAVYATDDGQQTADMSKATFTDPNKDIICIIYEEDAFITTTDFEAAEAFRNPDALSTTIFAQSEHHFMSPSAKAVVSIALDTAEGTGE